MTAGSIQRDAGNKAADSSLPAARCQLPALVQRFLVIAALMFWQGGFLFYVAVVVPIGTEVLGSAAEQALITRRVTWQLNVTGAVALAIFAWDLFMTRRRTWGRRAAWLIMAVALVVLVVLHGHLDSMFLTDQLRVVDRPTFHFWHRTYLWVSTVQWAAAIAFAVLSLAAWRAEDRKPLIVSG